jgi:hypothetical protein
LKGWRAEVLGREVGKGEVLESKDWKALSCTADRIRHSLCMEEEASLCMDEEDAAEKDS